ncbi:MAG: HAD family hydrolase [Salinibacter sp.]
MAQQEQGTSYAVIFDMDGVLINSEPLHDQVQRQFARELGIELSPDFFKQFRGVDGWTFWSYVVAEYDLELSVDELLEEDRDRYIAAIESDADIKAILGANELVQRLRKDDVPIALASSSSRRQIRAVLDRLDLQPAFRVQVGGDEVETGKPDPAIFRLAAERLGFPAARCVVIEDSTNGVTAAKQAGMACIGFNGLFHNDQELSEADAVVNDLRNVSALSINDLLVRGD